MMVSSILTSTFGNMQHWHLSPESKSSKSKHHLETNLKLCRHNTEQKLNEDDRELFLPNFPSLCHSPWLIQSTHNLACLAENTANQELTHAGGYKYMD